MDKYIVSQYLNGSLLENGRSLNSFYSYRFGGLNERENSTFLGIYAKDEERKCQHLISRSSFHLGECACSIVGRGGTFCFLGGLSTSFRIFDFQVECFHFLCSLPTKMRLNDLYVMRSFACT